MKKNPLLFFLSLPLLLLSSEITIEVSDLTQKGDAFSTDQGGTIQMGDLRVQAKKLLYEEKGNERLLRADGNLLIIYGNKFFIGDSFLYNFKEKTGLLQNGICHVNGIYVGGNEIAFHNDGKINIEQAFLTRSEDKNSAWALKAQEVLISPNFQMSAKNATVEMGHRTLFWLPAYSMTVSKKYKQDSPLQTRITWERGHGPLAWLRYKILDNHGWKSHVRCEYRMNRGVGLSLDVDYKDKFFPFSLSSKNFYAHDTFISNPLRSPSRYRMQGLFKGHLLEKKVEASVKWDFLSDKDVRSDFSTQTLFELASPGKTEASIQGRFDPIITSLYAKKRLNSFESTLLEELPTCIAAFKPLDFGSTGILFDQTLKASVLNYAYANHLQNDVRPFHATKFEMTEKLLRPFCISFLQITPEASFHGIFYSNSPLQKEVIQSVFNYQIEARAPLEKDYLLFTHTLEPYITYHRMEEPLARLGIPYIFSLQDVFGKVDEMRFGIKNELYRRDLFSSLPRFESEFYTYHFFNQKQFTKAFPKTGLDLAWNFSTLSLSASLGWNLQEGVYDHVNMGAFWTLNENIALSGEFFQRGPFEWRKSDPSNHILDLTREDSDLLFSPLSDARTSCLTRMQFQLAPKVALQLYHHFGWHENAPLYRETKMDLSTILFDTWRLKLSSTWNSKLDDPNMSFLQKMQKRLLPSGFSFQFTLEV